MKTQRLSHVRRNINEGHVYHQRLKTERITKTEYGREVTNINNLYYFQMVKLKGSFYKSNYKLYELVSKTHH